MTAWLIAHPGPDLWLCVGLMCLFVWSAAYWLSGTARRHLQILIAWGIQTFTDPKRDDEEKAFSRAAERSRLFPSTRRPRAPREISDR